MGVRKPTKAKRKGVKNNDNPIKEPAHPQVPQAPSTLPSPPPPKPTHTPPTPYTARPIPLSQLARAAFRDLSQARRGGLRRLAARLGRLIIWGLRWVRGRRVWRRGIGGRLRIVGMLRMLLLLLLFGRVRIGNRRNRGLVWLILRLLLDGLRYRHTNQIQT